MNTMTLTADQAWHTLHRPLKHFILKHTHDDALADDILQDVFLKLLTHIETLQNEEKLQSWLYQITRHTIYDYYRSQKTSVTLPEPFDLAEEPAQLDVSQALLPSIKEMVDHLPEPYREAIILTEYQGLTQKELASHLHLSFSGAKSRVQRARKQLKQMLLACCDFVFDRRGKIIAYHPRNQCCTTSSCCPL